MQSPSLSACLLQSNIDPHLFMWKEGASPSEVGPTKFVSFHFTTKCQCFIKNEKSAVNQREIWDSLPIASGGINQTFPLEKWAPQWRPLGISQLCISFVLSCLFSHYVGLLVRLRLTEGPRIRMDPWSCM